MVKMHTLTHSRAPNTSALLPCWSLTDLPLTMEMDASPGTSPNLVLWLSCFADLTTFENNTEVSACAFKEGQRECFHVRFCAKLWLQLSLPWYLQNTLMGATKYWYWIRKPGTNLPPPPTVLPLTKKQVMFSLLRCSTNKSCCSFMHVSLQVPWLKTCKWLV